MSDDQGFRRPGNNQFPLDEFSVEGKYKYNTKDPYPAKTHTPRKSERPGHVSLYRRPHRGKQPPGTKK